MNDLKKLLSDIANLILEFSEKMPNETSKTDTMASASIKTRAHQIGEFFPQEKDSEDDLIALCEEILAKKDVVPHRTIVFVEGIYKYALRGNLTPSQVESLKSTHRMYSDYH